VTGFSLERFYRFCRALQIETKEQGLRSLWPLMGSQQYVMSEIGKGIEDDVHFFVVLKARQLGITTVTLALDLYWNFTHPGLQSTLVTDTEENRDMFKSTLGMYIAGLPNAYKIPVLAHNRNLLELASRSRLFYQVAGLRSKGSLGRGKGITYLHGTETSSWGDEEGLASLLASLAEQNPARLYVFESTARSFNIFYDMWTTAKRAHTQRAIFCGWWRNEFYAAPHDSPIYQTYWDGRFTAEERDWTRDIKALYDYDITPNQIAWWRWKTVEGLRDEALMYQEFPPTEDYAFIMTGTSFFSTARCTEEAKTAVKTRPDCYRYEFTTEFHQLTVAKTTERLATLKVWEEPVKDAYYVIGADPAYGSSDWADRFCISVFRCYADGLDQVAEFNTSECLPHQFAWVIAHLAGAYGNSVLNLEVNGPGQPTITELKRIKQKASMLEGAQGHDLCNVLAGMSHYIWRKQDSMSGPTMSLGWLTTEGSKERMLAYFKDYFERGMMKVLSMELLEEMKTVMRHDGRLGAPGRGKDDRVIAAALACAAFSEQVQSSLIYAKKTRAESRVEIGKTAMEIGTNKSVSKWLKAIGIYADEGARR
jgi:hypothetical protein